MSKSIPADRPPIDPHPLSPYVAWAGNRNRDPDYSHRLQGDFSIERQRP